MGTGWRHVLWPEDSARRFIHVLLLLYIVKQLLIAILMPPFTGRKDRLVRQWLGRLR